MAVAFGSFITGFTSVNGNEVKWCENLFYFEGKMLYLHKLFTWVIFPLLYFLLYSFAVFGGFRIIYLLYALFKIEEDDFKEISYHHLKVGTYNKIGKFVLIYIIPIMLLTIILSLIGLIYVIFLKRTLFITYIVTFIIMITTFISIWLIPRHIRAKIKKFKKIEKENLKSVINSIEANYTSKVEEFKNLKENINIEAKYSKLSPILYFYNEIVNLNNWPYSLRWMKISIFSVISGILTIIYYCIRIFQLI